VGKSDGLRDALSVKIEGFVYMHHQEKGKRHAIV
jgi:hypothetical protein